MGKGLSRLYLIFGFLVDNPDLEMMSLDLGYSDSSNGGGSLNLMFVRR